MVDEERGGACNDEQGYDPEEEREVRQFRGPLLCLFEKHARHGRRRNRNSDDDCQIDCDILEEEQREISRNQRQEPQQGYAYSEIGDDERRNDITDVSAQEPDDDRSRVRSRRDCGEECDFGKFVLSAEFQDSPQNQRDDDVEREDFPVAEMRFELFESDLQADQIEHDQQENADHPVEFMRPGAAISGNECRTDHKRTNQSFQHGGNHTF